MQLGCAVHADENNSFRERMSNMVAVERGRRAVWRPLMELPRRLNLVAALARREPEKDSTLRCQLDVSRTWVPREQISSDDERDLGVAVNRAWAE